MICRTAEVEDGNGAGLMPLPFLIEVLHSAKAPAAMKVKVASATLPYTQPKPSKRPATPTVVADRYGFAVDPVLAKKLRNGIVRLGVLKNRRKPTAKERAAARDSAKKCVHCSRPYSARASKSTSPRTRLGTKKGCSICFVSDGRARNSHRKRTPSSLMSMRAIGRTKSVQKTARGKDCGC